MNEAYSSKTGVLVTQPANGAELPVSGVRVLLRIAALWVPATF
jgi:hypothetical protein